MRRDTGDGHQAFDSEPSRSGVLTQFQSATGSAVFDGGCGRQEHLTYVY